MKITDLKVDGFGAWSDLDVGELEKQITVFFGPNEAGKTTLLQFVRAVLYGFSPERRARYVPPASGGPTGGTVAVSGANGHFRVLRRLAPHAGPDELGEVTILGADGKQQGRQLLETLLSGVDEQIFNNVFAVGPREFQQLGSLEDTEAADQLYNLTCGLDRVSLADVLRHLAEARTRILSGEPSQGEAAPTDVDRCEIGRLLQHREKLRREIGGLDATTARWAGLHQRRDAVDRDVEHLDCQVKEREDLIRVVEAALAVRAPWERRRAIRGQIQRTADRDAVPRGAIGKLDRIEAKIERHRLQREQLMLQRAEWKEEIDALELNESLWHQAARIKALREQDVWIGSLEKQIAQLDEESAELELRLRRATEQFGLEANVRLSKLPEITSHTLAVLRVPARSLRREQKRLERARAEIQADSDQAQAIQEKIDSALVDQGVTDLGTSLEQAGNLVARLRQRLQLNDRLDQLGRQRDELERERRHWFRRQALPAWALGALGVVFVFFATLVIAGLFGSVLSIGGTASWVMMAVGTIGSVGTLAAKAGLEHSAGSHARQCNRQIETLEARIARAKRECEQLDAQLPGGGGPLVVRLGEAEQRLAHLETLAPLDSENRVARQRADGAHQQAARAEASLKEAQRRWRSALRSAGLPESLRPSQIRKLAEHADEVAGLKRRLETVREDADGRRRELNTVTDRVFQLLLDTGLEPVGDDCLAQLEQLGAALREQEQWFGRRGALRKKARRLRARLDKHAQAVRKLRALRRSILADAGVADEDELRRLAKHFEQADELQRQCEQLSGEIASAARCDEDELAEQLDHRTDGQLRSLADEARRFLDQSGGRLAQLHRHHGELTREIETLAEDRRLGEARLELESVEEQLRRAVRHWQTVAVTELLLTSICEIYEVERQPETLAEASVYLKQLTEGRYARVWTPLGENVLRVDESSGRCLPIQKLSRGTREQVFLSLRLALAAAYARRGVAVPLILDDVLVNFDKDRSAAAAAVLRDFAKAGHQVLLFTCHEHIMDVFNEAGVDVRRLPRVDRRPVTERAAEAAAIEPAPPVPMIEETQEELTDEYEDEVESQDEEDEQEDEQNIEEDDYEEEEEEYEEEDEEPVDEDEQDESEEEEEYEEDEEEEEEDQEEAEGLDDEADEDEQEVELNEALEENDPAAHADGEEEVEWEVTEADIDESDDEYDDLPWDEEAA